MADKVKIAKHFILSSPYGQLKDVIHDVKSIIDDESLMTPELVHDLRVKYNQDHLFFSKKDGDNVLVSSFGAVDATHYLDPRSNKVYTFDHEKLEFVGAASESEQKLDARVEGYRSQIDAAVTKYLESFFDKTKSAASVYAANDGKIHIAISARNVNLPAFWSGGWVSVYSLSVASPGEAVLKGRIKVKVHYFEEGNVQLDAALDKEARVQVSQDADATGRAVAAAVEKLESDFHAQLEEFYVNMNTNTFKAMRRFLPVSRKPMEWNSNAHKLAADLNK